MVIIAQYSPIWHVSLLFMLLYSLHYNKGDKHVSEHVINLFCLYFIVVWTWMMCWISISMHWRKAIKIRRSDILIHYISFTEFLPNQVNTRTRRRTFSIHFPYIEWKYCLLWKNIFKNLYIHRTICIEQYVWNSIEK